MTPWTAACQASLPITNSRSLLKLMSIELVMPSNHLILCRPFLLPLSIFPASLSFQMSQFFTSWSKYWNISFSISPSNESALCIGWPTYWSFSFSITPSNKYSGLISLRIDWFEHLESWIYSLMSIPRLGSTQFHFM